MHIKCRVQCSTIFIESSKQVQGFNLSIGDIVLDHLDYLMLVGISQSCDKIIVTKNTILHLKGTIYGLLSKPSITLLSIIKQH